MKKEGLEIRIVRKVCGFARPREANELAFNRAADQVAEAKPD